MFRSFSEEKKNEKYNRIAKRLQCYSSEKDCYKTYEDFIDDFREEPLLTDFQNIELIKIMIQEDVNSMYLNKNEGNAMICYYNEFFKDLNHWKYISEPILFKIVKTNPTLNRVGDPLKSIFAKHSGFSKSYSRRLSQYKKNINIYIDFLKTYIELFNELTKPFTNTEKQYDNIFKVKLNTITSIDTERFRNDNNPKVNQYIFNTFIQLMLSFSIFINELMNKNKEDEDMNVLTYIKENMAFSSLSKYYIIMKELSTHKPITIDDDPSKLGILNLWVSELNKYTENVLKFFDKYYDFNLINTQEKLTWYQKELNLPVIHTAMISIKDRGELIDIIYKHKDKLNLPDNIYGLTPIVYAILFQNIEAIKVLTTTSAMLQKQKTISKYKLLYDFFKVNKETINQFIDNNKNIHNLPTVLYTSSDCIDIRELANRTKNDEIIRLINDKMDIRKRWNDFEITQEVIKNHIEKNPNQMISTYINENQMYFHQTNEHIAQIILNTPQNEHFFLAGSSGMYGSGIYFAKTYDETEKKALSKGTILKAQVLLGVPMIIESTDTWEQFFKSYKNLDADIIHSLLKVQGFDSVIAIKNKEFMKTGNEYIVYNTEQVIDVTIVANRKTKKGGEYRMRKEELDKQIQIFIRPWLEHIHNLEKAPLKILNQLQTRWLLNQTALMVACARGHVSSVQWLLNNQRRMLDQLDLYGRNALFYAIHGGNIAIVKLLIDKKINLIQQDTKGTYAIELFSYKHYIGYNSINYRSILLRTLLQYESDPVVKEILNKFYIKTGRQRNTVTVPPTIAQTTGRPWSRNITQPSRRPVSARNALFQR